METGLHWKTAAPLILGSCWGGQAGKGGVQVTALGIRSHKGIREQLAHSLLAFGGGRSVGLLTSSDVVLHPFLEDPFKTQRFRHPSGVEQNSQGTSQLLFGGNGVHRRQVVAEISHLHALLWLCCLI